MLDAEKAFDAIPHSVLLYKASMVLKDHWSFSLYYYTLMSVFISVSPQKTIWRKYNQN
jgi:hypothetical protein